MVRSLRAAVVSGQFYPDSPSQIEKMCTSWGEGISAEETMIGCVSPHAGYMYSGAVAAKVLARFSQKDTFIILGPNHTGLGKEISIYAQGIWQTPLGNCEVDQEMATAIQREAECVVADTIAHRFEHSIEVQLPLLMVFQRASFRIVPICLKEMDKKQRDQLSSAIAHVIGISGKRVGIIASSDMTHYKMQETAAQQDAYVIDALLKLDADMIEERVRQHNISMCGCFPVACAVKSSKAQGAQRAILVDYKTSGDVSGDYHSVVGYAAVGFYK